MQFFDNFPARWTGIGFWIASLWPWFKYASFEYKKAYFSDNLNFDFKGPKGVRTPSGPALPPISGISIFFRSSLYIKRTQETYDFFLVHLREGLM